MQHISNLKTRTIADGITGQYIHGAGMSMGLVKLEKGSVVPLHQHPHEQITYILEGELQMNIGGVDMVLTPGTYHIIPSGVPHSAKTLTDCVLIDAFNPVREDYR